LISSTSYMQLLCALIPKVQQK
jgi:hypothetical protein